MNVFFNWQRIREITDLYLLKASSSLREGLFFFPHAFGFMASVDEEQNGLHVAVPPKMVRDRAMFDGFVRYVARSLPPQGRIEAAGFLVLLPRELAAEIVEVGPSVPDVKHDLVSIFHVEHVFDGVHTWVLDRPDGEWKLVATGTRSTIPPCLPTRAYGNTVGQA